MVSPDIALWRIAKHTLQYRADDLSGGGAKITGGRWNSKGQAVLYASTSIALATLETLAHLGDNIAIRNVFLIRLNIPLSLWKQRRILSPDDLDPTWCAEPPGSASVVYGDDWLRSTGSALMLVPSVIIHEEFNVLINPAHPACKRISASVVRQFVYDPKL